MKMRSLMFLVLTALALNFTGCAHKKDTKGSDADGSASGDMAMTLKLNGESDSRTAGALQTVHFAFDSAELSADSQGELDKNATFMKENTSVKVLVEGHCDERGGIQYNLALGERRAKAVKNYLVALGIAADRLNTVSYGKERPLEFGHAEEAWGKNRRANFVVTELK